jgi:hypothetical protein
MSQPIHTPGPIGILKPQNLDADFSIRVLSKRNHRGRKSLKSSRRSVSKAVWIHLTMRQKPTPASSPPPTTPSTPPRASSV